MRGFINLPQFDDEEKNQQARHLFVILWVLILAITAGSIGMLFTLPDKALRWLILIAAVDSIGLGLIALTHRGYTRLVSVLTILLSWVLVTVLASTADGIRSSSTFFYITIVIIAGVLLGTRAGVITAVGCSLSGLGMVVAKSVGFLPQNAVQSTDFSIWISLVEVLAISTGLQYLSSSSIKKSLHKVQQELVERRRAESAMRESESRFRNLAEATFEGIIITENGLIIDANRQLAQMIGYPLVEVYGMSLVSFVTPADKKRAEEILVSGEENIGEYRVQRKDGTEILVESHGRGFQMNQRRVRVTSVRDITEHKRAEEALSREAERSKVIARVAARLNASLGLKEVLDAVCEETARVLEVPVSMVWLLDDDQKYFRAQAAFGIPPELYAQILPTPNTLKSLRQEAPINIYFQKDIQQDQDNPNILLAKKLDLHANMNCWFYYESRLIGLLIVLRHEFVWNYSDSDLTLMDTLSNQIAIAIHHAQLYEQVKGGRARLQTLSEKLVDIQEAERRHLAIELHDEIGQALTHIKMSLDRFDPAHPEKGNLETAKELTLDLMKRVRGLSLELRPTVLDDLGLLPAVLWHIERYTALTGIQVDFKPSEADRRFRAQVESTVYRILQESLTNVARHAAATQAAVSLWADEERLGLQVEDNGVGFDPAAVHHQGTGGLSGMRERAEICGGQLLVDSTPGKGTYISLVLPLQGEFIERRSR